MEYIIVLIVFIFFLAIIAIVKLNQSYQKDTEEIKNRSRKVKAEYEEKLKTIIIPAYNQSRTELINRNGNPTKAFILGQYNLNKEIIAFDESKRIWICGNDIPMKSILSCTLTDNKNIVKGQITSATKTNNGNMVKRAVIGNVLLGSSGAFIGGSTASKSTITTQGNDKVIHNYTIILNVDSLLEPIIRVPIGSNKYIVDDIVGLMNVIINRR
ncbi:MAG: hypothetical protein ACQEWD_05860 [Bacteroidota bacterium]